MRKLTMNLEALEVESFDAGEVPDLNGTVRGNEGTAAECLGSDNGTCLILTCTVSQCGGTYCVDVTTNDAGGGQGFPTAMYYTCNGGYSCAGPSCGYDPNCQPHPGWESYMSMGPGTCLCNG